MGLATSDFDPLAQSLRPSEAYKRTKSYQEHPEIIFEKLPRISRPEAIVIVKKFYGDIQGSALRNLIRTVYTPRASLSREAFGYDNSGGIESLCPSILLRLAKIVRLKSSR